MLGQRKKSMNPTHIQQRWGSVTINDDKDLKNYDNNVYPEDTKEI